MLKLLDYENKFCKSKGFKPLTKQYFSQQHSNPSEQFINFISVVSWLFSINNHQVTGWNKYDDPMTASQQEMRMKDHKEIVRKELAKYRHQATMDNSLQQIH